MSSPPAATTLPPVASEGPSSLVTDVDLELRHPWRTGQAANKEHAFLCQINRNEEQGRPVGRGGDARMKDGRVREWGCWYSRDHLLFS